MFVAHILLMLIDGGGASMVSRLRVACLATNVVDIMRRRREYKERKKTGSEY
jgi:hypothetical protein